MKKTSIILVLILALLFSVTGCSGSATQVVGQGEKTADYLTGKFAQKLEEEGAEVYTGKITEAKFLSGSTSQITFLEDSKDKGSKPRNILLDPKVQVVYVTNSSPDGAVMEGKEFVKSFVPGSNDTFKVFTLDDKVVLLFSAEL